MTPVAAPVVQRDDEMPRPAQPAARSEMQLTDEQMADLANPDKQQEFRAAYLLQLERLGCPGCRNDSLYPF